MKFSLFLVLNVHAKDPGYFGNFTLAFPSMQGEFEYEYHKNSKEKIQLAVRKRKGGLAIFEASQCSIEELSEEILKLDRIRQQIISALLLCLYELISRRENLKKIHSLVLFLAEQECKLTDDHTLLEVFHLIDVPEQDLADFMK